MKSDKIADAVIGIDDDLIEAADTRKTSKNIFIKWGSLAAAFIIVAGGVFAFSGAFDKKGSKTAVPEAPEQTTADTAAAFSGTTEKVSYAQQTAFIDEEKATTELDTDYVFNGKTIAEYQEEYGNAWLLANKCETLVKDGDALKYGEALYLIGTPDGEKWDKDYYTERVGFYGELLDKYIINGEFLIAELQKDLADAYEKCDEASAAYHASVSAYYAEKGIDAVSASDEEVLTAYNVMTKEGPYAADE